MTYHLLSIHQFEIKEIFEIFNSIPIIKKHISVPISRLACSNKIIVNAFFEPSTRTSLSFASAMYRLGGNVITFNKEYSSINKGESFPDTIRTISSFGDILILRHPERGIMMKAIENSQIPIINAGDGDGEHPSQAILDLYTIYHKFGYEFQTKTILFVGDIKNSRTIHSLLELLHMFPSMKIYFLPFHNKSPTNIMINKVKQFHNQSDNLIFTFSNVKFDLFDIVYCTRNQTERESSWVMTDSIKHEKPDFIINNYFVNKLNDDCILLHPLPRNQELNDDVDSNHRSYFFKQMELGVEVRMAILEFVMNKNNKSLLDL